MSNIKIITSTTAESVVCTLPNGEEIEIEMIDIEGEDALAAPDIDVAIEMLQGQLRDTVRRKLKPESN